MELVDIKEACEILNLDYKEFVSIPEIEKGVVDYKVLYEQQKALNETILNNICEISKSFDGRLDLFKNEMSDSIKDQIKELKKSFGNLKDEIEDMKNTPMRKQKSVTKVSVIEKSVNQNNFSKTFNLQDYNSLRELKKYLGDKAIEELQKGVNNSIYERAAIQLDASRKLSPDLARKLMEVDKILIQ